VDLDSLLKGKAALSGRQDLRAGVRKPSFPEEFGQKVVIRPEIFPQKAPVTVPASVLKKFLIPSIRYEITVHKSLI